jgi:hypothetical protein
MASLRGSVLMTSLFAVCYAPNASALEVRRSPETADCPDAGTIVSKVAAMSGRASPAARWDDVVVSFERAGSAHQARLTMMDETERLLRDDGEGCDGLVDAVVLVLVLSMDTPPTNAVVRRQAPVKPVDTTLPASTTPPALAPAVHPPPYQHDASKAVGLPPLAARVLVGGGGSFGVVGELAPGLHLAFHTGPVNGTWAVGLLGRAVAVETSLGAGSATLSYVGSGVEACARLWRSPAGAFEPCARIEVGALSGRARDFAKNDSSTRPWVSGGVAARGVLTISGAVQGFVEGAVLAPAVRERFEIEGAGAVYAPPPVNGNLMTGAAVVFR